MKKVLSAKHLKSKALVVLLCTMISLSMATPIEAFFYPGAVPADDSKSNQFGPMSANLLITPWGDNTAEFNAFLACDADIMDWSLDADQSAQLETADPNMDTYARAFYFDRGMRECDLNNMRFPFSDANFRRAASYCIDKDTFIANVLGGLALKMDSPLAAHGAYYNPYCDDLYAFNPLFTEAKAILDANGYVDSDSDGWREGPAGQEIFVECYIRQDDPIRTAMGLQWCANLELIGVQCDEQVAPKATCQNHAMVTFDYDMYTGGWSFGRDPDFVCSMYSSFYAQTFEGTCNYPGYANPEYDLHADAMVTATEVGDGYTPCTAVYHAWEMQRILMDDAGVIPVFTYASYGGYKSDWNKVANAYGVGPWGYYTFLDTYKVGDDTIDWGFANDIESLNPFYAGSKEDWQILDKIYDTMIKENPYTLQDQPWLAKSWSQGEWTYEGNPCTWVEFKLREDVYWQDVSAKADRRTPSGTLFLRSGAVDAQFTADDVKFTIDAFRDLVDSRFHAYAGDVVFVEGVDLFTVKVYFGVLNPLWALNRIGGIPILPKHVWEPAFLEGTLREFDAYDEDCLSGTGPWRFDKAASSLGSYYMLRAYPRFFRYHPVDVVGEVTPVSSSTVRVSFYLHNMDSQRSTIPSGTFALTIKRYGYYGSVDVLFSGSNPNLPYCSKVLLFQCEQSIYDPIFNYTATISPDPLTGHADQDGYIVYSYWSGGAEDINRDGFVNAKDAVIMGAHMFTKPGDGGWDPRCDIVRDFKVDFLDEWRMHTFFGGPPSGQPARPPSFSASDAYLSPLNAERYVEPNSCFTVDVSVFDAIDLKGCGFTLQYDASILNLVSAEILSPTGWGPPIKFIRPSGAGSIVELYTMSGSLTGNATLARLTFRGVKNGYSSLSLSETTLARSYGLLFTHETNSDYVFVRNNWRMLGCNAARTSFSPTDAPDTNVTAWIASLEYSSDFSPIVTNGMVIVSEGHGTVQAFSEDDGKSIWNHTLPHNGGLLAAEGNMIFDAVPNGRTVFALNAASGEEIWNWTDPLGLTEIESATVSAHRLFYVTHIAPDYSKIVCLNTTTGALLWEYVFSGRMPKQVAVDQSRVYVLYDTKADRVALGCVSSEDGSPLWEYITEYDTPLAMAVANGQVVFSTSKPMTRIYALDAVDGTEAWNTTLDLGWRGDEGTVAVAYCKVFAFFHESGHYLVCAFDEINGTEIWSIEPDWGVCSLVVADGKVFVSTGKPWALSALNETDGTGVWTYNVSLLFGLPVVANGRLFAARGDLLYAFGQGKQAEATVRGYHLYASTNATILCFDATRNAMRLAISGESGDMASVNVTFPIGLNRTAISVFVDGFPLEQPPSITTNGTHYLIYFEHPLSVHKIDIQYAILDLAVADASASKTVIGQGYPMTLNATVGNCGQYDEDCLVSIYRNATLIEQMNFTLPSGNTTSFLIQYNTSSIAYGWYEYSVLVAPLTGETEIDNNARTLQILTVTIPGDINGDQYVNAKDAVLLGSAFYPAGMYNPNADINDDGYVNAKDAVILGAYFGQHWP